MLLLLWQSIQDLFVRGYLTIRISNALLLLMWISFSYLFLTTNRLMLHYEEISVYLRPVQMSLLATGMICAIYSGFHSFQAKESTTFFAGVFSALLLSTLLLALPLLEPCLYEHSSSMTDHAHPHSIAQILKQSLLCPAYSIGSIFYLGFTSIIWATLALSSLFALRR